MSLSSEAGNGSGRVEAPLSKYKNRRLLKQRRAQEAAGAVVAQQEDADMGERVQVSKGEGSSSRGELPTRPPVMNLKEVRRGGADPGRSSSLRPSDAASSSAKSAGVFSFGSFPSMEPYVASEHSEYCRQKRERTTANMADGKTASGGGAAKTSVGSRGFVSSAGSGDSMISEGKYALRPDPKYPGTYRPKTFQPAPVTTMRVACLLVGDVYVYNRF